MSGGLDPHYDFALLGTSLPLSILSAALSRAGFTVLHIDEEEHYGGPWASLTLSELLEWKRNKALHQSQGRHNVSISFPAFHSKTDSDDIPPELISFNRHFAISLVPTIVPCSGPTIDVLIRSKVASYCTFRLLQKTALYSEEGGRRALKKVPASKEDIFKDKDLSLIDKRKLMKLLQAAAGNVANTEVASDTPPAVDENTSHLPFLQHLASRNGPNLSSQLAANIAYGVALCTSDQENTLTAMEKIRRHITSIGRYGNAAYLVGQYGGAGEMAQCFCRASAVQGGTFVLGHQIKQCSLTQQDGNQAEATDSKWSIALEGIDGSAQVNRVIADEDITRRLRPKEMSSYSNDARITLSGILLLDRGISFEDTEEASPETGLVVFPPREGSKIGTVTALQMAEGTFSCPKGMYLIHLSAAVITEATNEIDANQELREARNRILELAKKSKGEWIGENAVTENDTSQSALLPLMECYYTCSEALESNFLPEEHGWYTSPMHTSSIATSLDRATVQAEDSFWSIIGTDKRSLAEEARKKRKTVGYTVGRGLGGILDDSEKTEMLCDFFPGATEIDGDEEEE